MGEYDDLIAAVKQPAVAAAKEHPAQDDYADLIAAARESTPSASPLPSPTFFDHARALGSSLAQPFVDIGKGALAANDFAARAIFHPIDTFGGGKALPTLREGMRGVNDNIPFANRAVEAIGGPPAESPQDAAAAPGARAAGGVAGIPAGGMVGGIAAKGVETAAPVLGRILGRIGTAAEDRTIARTLEDLEVRTNKRTRAGIRQDVVEDAVREEPALRRAAGDDVKLSGVTSAMKEIAGRDLKTIYKGVPPIEDIAAPISNIDKKIAELELGTGSDAAVAKQLEAIREEMNARYGKRAEIKVEDLRAEQSDLQKRGYGKSIPGDEAGTARIAAAREASKAIGDAVVEHVTGMGYEAAKVAAAADPNSLAAQLFKANDTINAANKIEAGIADRAARVQPRHGLAGKLLDTAKELKHSPMGWAASKAPYAAAKGMGAADRTISRVLPAFDRGLQRLPGLAAAGAGAPAVTPLAVSNLMQAARAGASRVELQAQAASDGTPPEIADNIAQQFGR